MNDEKHWSKSIKGSDPVIEETLEKTVLVRENKYIPKEDRDFFVLLRIGLWQTVEEPLSDSPNWAYIYQLAVEQTVQGIIADGIGIARANGLLRTSESQDSGISGKEETPETCGEPVESIPNSRAPEISQYWNDKFLSASAQVVRRNWSINQLQAKICALFNDPSRINELFPQAQKRGDSITVPGTVIEENVEILVPLCLVYPEVLEGNDLSTYWSASSALRLSSTKDKQGAKTFTH